MKKNEKMLKEKHNPTSNKLQIIGIAVAIIVGIIVSYPIIKDNFFTEEKTQEISIRGVISSPIMFDEIICLSNLSFEQMYPDSLFSSYPDRDNYEFSDIITIFMNIDLSGDGTRKVSAFLIDSNDLIYMSLPSLSSKTTNKILNENITIQDILISDSNTNFNLEDKLSIKFHTEDFQNIISHGKWRIVIIIWKTTEENNIIPTLMVTETVSLGEYKEENSIFSFIFVFLSIFIAILGISYPFYYAYKKKKLSDVMDEDAYNLDSIKKQKIKMLIEENNNNLQLIEKLISEQVHFITKSLLDKKMKQKKEKKYIYSPDEIKEIKKGGLYIDKNNLSFEVALQILNQSHIFKDNKDLIQKIKEYVKISKSLNSQKEHCQQWILSRGLPNPDEAKKYYDLLDEEKKTSIELAQILNNHLK